MQNQRPPDFSVVQQLRTMLMKLKSHSWDFAEVEFQIHAPAAPGEPFAIDLSQGRFSRRVTVDNRQLKLIGSPAFDSEMLRELRNAVRSLVRLNENRKQK